MSPAKRLTGKLVRDHGQEQRERVAQTVRVTVEGEHGERDQRDEGEHDHDAYLSENRRALSEGMSLSYKGAEI